MLKFFRMALGLLVDPLFLFLGIGIGMIYGISFLQGRPQDLTMMPSTTDFKERSFLVRQVNCARGEAMISRKEKPNEWIFVKLPSELPCNAQAHLVTVHSDKKVLWN